MKDTINEATLEARINHVLNNIFPTFKDVNVVHQKSFSIKFGHHNVLVDLEEPSKYAKRAICDILLTINGQNIILLELKREGLKLTETDEYQGISYARLVHPMPPLTLISNGRDNRFFNTYTKEKLDVSKIDIEYIKNLTDTSFELALSDFKEAVNLILNKDNNAFAQVINQISEEKFKRLYGNLTDFSKTICLDFSIDRSLIKKVQNHFSNEVSLVGIIGSAFSGKTNLLHQFFNSTKSNTSFLFFIDCNDHNYSILQQLANHFTQNSKMLISKDKIREWLINSLSSNSDAKFYLLIDNFNNDIPEDIKNEIIELIDIFKGANQFILYTIDEFNYKKIAFVENRQYKTIIGEQSQIEKLDELSDDEYNFAQKLLYEKHQLVIENGGHFTPEYREPRILRQLVNVYNGEISKDQIIKIIAVPDLELLNTITESKIYTKLTHNIYKKIVFCFFKENKLRKKDTDLNIVANGSGAISVISFKKYFSDDFETLMRSSYIVLRELRNGVTVIYPKISELFAKHSILVITELILNEKNENKTYDEICKYFIELITPIPYCDIVATGVLMELVSKNEVELFSELVQKLLEIPPKFKNIGKGTKTVMYSQDLGHIEMNFEDDMSDGGFLADFMPYAILSQLAGYPLGLIDNEEYSQFDFHIYLLETVGSNENFLRRADVRSITNMKSIDSYEFEGIGKIISGNEGIIEPFVQSIQKCFFNIPKEIEKLYNKAFEDNNILLIWRIYLALRDMDKILDPMIADQAKEFLMKFDKYFSIFMADFLTRSIEDKKEKERMRTLLLNMKD